MREVVAIMERLFSQVDPTNAPATAEAIEAGTQTEAAPTNIVDTSSSLPPVQFVSPKLQGMPPIFILISQGT